jgi:hypothetical protein
MTGVCILTQFSDLPGRGGDGQVAEDRSTVPSHAATWMRLSVSDFHGQDRFFISSRMAMMVGELLICRNCSITDSGICGTLVAAKPAAKAGL